MSQIRIELLQAASRLRVLILFAALTFACVACVSAPDDVEQEFEPRKASEKSHFHAANGR